MSVNSNLGMCAFNGCDNNRCLVLTNANTGRLTQLPKCTEHAGVLAGLHNEYKVISQKNISMYNKIPTVVNVAEKIELMKAFAKSLKSEISARTKQAESIKPMYRDPGHFSFLNTLFRIFETNQKQLAALQDQNKTGG